MNDRFRFRVWDTEKKELIYDAEKAYDYMRPGDGKILEVDCFGDVLKNKRYIVEQCTGLKDKSGRLIYEGDLVKPDIARLEEKQWAEIKFGNSDGFQCFYTHWYGKYAKESKYNPGWRKDIFFWLKDGLKIIGNIHENPELLETHNEN